MGCWVLFSSDGEGSRREYSELMRVVICTLEQIVEGSTELHRVKHEVSKQKRKEGTSVVLRQRPSNPFGTDAERSVGKNWH